MDPEVELNEKIVTGIWKWGWRLRQFYDRHQRKIDEREKDAARKERIEKMIGSYDDFVITQVILVFGIYGIYLF